jgi:hypothetical protein
VACTDPRAVVAGLLSLLGVLGLLLNATRVAHYCQGEKAAKGEGVGIPDLSATGLLPLGRYECVESEIEARFVCEARFTPSTSRVGIWRDFKAARVALEAIVPVLAVWLGGSFLTAKLDPDDIDALFLVDERVYPRLSPRDRVWVTAFSTKNALKSWTGWRVDSFVLPWAPFPEPAPTRPDQASYYLFRGYWDDWWQRVQVSVPGTPSLPADSIPQRGYLEVTYRDYLRP